MLFQWFFVKILQRKWYGTALCSKKESFWWFAYVCYATKSRCFATNTPNSFIALHNMKPMCNDLQRCVVAMIFREKLQRKCDGTALCSKNESLWWFAYVGLWNNIKVFCNEYTQQFHCITQRETDVRRFATVCCCYDFSEKYYNKSGMERLCVAKTKVCGDLRISMSVCKIENLAVLSW